MKRITQSVTTLFYRLAQSCVRSLPASVLRFRPFGIYEIVLSSHETSAETTFLPANQRMRWVTTQDEARSLSEIASPENIADWNNTSRRAAAIWQDQQPVAVAWVAADSFSEDELGMHYCLQEEDVWLFAAVVAPELRRRGLYRQLLQFLIDQLSQTDCQRILLGVSTGNQPSIAAHTRLGAKRRGTIYAAKCLGLSFCKVQGGVQRLSKRCWAWRQAIAVSVCRE